MNIGIIGAVMTLTEDLSYQICQNDRIIRPELAEAYCWISQSIRPAWH